MKWPTKEVTYCRDKKYKWLKLWPTSARNFSLYSSVQLFFHLELWRLFT